MPSTPEEEPATGKPSSKKRPRLNVPRCLEIALAAAVLSLALTAAAVRGQYDLGPGKIEIGMRPKLKGATVVSVPPFGSVEASTHRAPAVVVLSPVSIDTYSAQELVESRPTRTDLVIGLRGELEAALKKYALRLIVGGLVAGVIVAGIARTRSVGELATSIGVGALVPLGLYVATFAGYNPNAFRQPTLTGAISRSPELLGPVQQFGARFSALRTELDEIGSITFQLYQFLAEQSAIPEDAIRILHISDLHLNPVGYDVAQLVADRFEVKAVIDSGDVTAEGSPIEVGFVDRITGFSVPYFFIRGNHDSLVTQQAVASKPNALVLDGSVGKLDGLTVFGLGDPLFTPDKTVEQPTNEEQREAKLDFARTANQQVAALDEVPDIVVVHDKLTARRLSGEVPLVIHGHEHRWSAQRLDGTLFLGVGSTGAAGLKSLAPESDSAIALQVLYFDAEDHSLVGYDRIDVRGPHQQFLLKRTVVAPEKLAEQQVEEQPALSPTLSPTTEPPSPALPPTASP